MIKKGCFKYKKAEFQLSFSMLFSIILIAIFVALAFYVISYFLKIQCSISLGSFKDSFQTEINRIWNSEVSENSEKSYMIGGIGKSCVEQVCFFNTQDNKFKGDFSEQYDQLINFVIEENNLYFYPTNKGSFLSFKIEHLDTSELKNNPQCFDVENSKATIPLKKGFEDALVSLG